MIMPEPRVCVAVLTWNNWADTDECLASLLQQDYANYFVVVVDNGSRDGSLERLRGKWRAQVEFVALAENRGVAAGYNAGIRKGLEEGADYVLLLNNDTTVSPVLVSRLVEGFAQGEGVVAVGPIIVYYDDLQRVWYAGGVYERWLGRTRHLGLHRRVEAFKPKEGQHWETDFVCGCAIMLSGWAIQEVGLLDESYSLYHEDLDWCLRAQAQGYRCLVVGYPLVAHKVSVSAGRRGSNVLAAPSAYFYARNPFKLARKLPGQHNWATFLLGQLFLRLPSYCYQMGIRRDWAGIRSYLAGLRDGLRLLWKGSKDEDGGRP